MRYIAASGRPRLFAGCVPDAEPEYRRPYAFCQTDRVSSPLASPPEPPQDGERPIAMDALVMPADAGLHVFRSAAPLDGTPEIDGKPQVTGRFDDTNYRGGSG